MNTRTLAVMLTVLVALSATANAQTYALTVNTGLGGGSYSAGESVPISAIDLTPADIFIEWTGDVAGIVDVNDPNTTITMPAVDATVTPTYYSFITGPGRRQWYRQR